MTGHRTRGHGGGVALRGAIEGALSIGLAPALLVIGFLTAGVSAGQVYPRARSAAYGGFWVGVLGATGLVLLLHGVDLGRVPLSGPRVFLVEVLGGAAVGAWTALGYIWFRDRAWIAAPLAFQTVGSLGLLHLFLSWPDARPDITVTTIAIALVATLFYTLFRDKPPLPRRARTRERVEAVGDPPDRPERPDPPS